MACDDAYGIRCLWGDSGFIDELGYDRLGKYVQFVQKKR